MRFDTKLTIFELRISPSSDLSLLEPKALAARLGPWAELLKGVHFEEDFAFLFFTGQPDLTSFLNSTPWLDLREVHHLRYDQWQDGALSPPIRLGPLEILPQFGDIDDPIKPNHTQPEQDQALRKSALKIDPGLAFGFGGHPTTLACLEFLIRIFKPGAIISEPIPTTVLDLGCGTGVLALAAAKLGALKVIGVDHSHLAVDSAKKNTRTNGLSDRVTIERGLAQDYAGEKAELLAANIPMFVLEDLIKLEAFLGRRYLVISGLLVEEGEIFLANLKRQLNFKLTDAKRSDRWVSYLIQPS
ncbi:MAG: 50S ribosomal protein L11 methyltransferase [Deltaproteobacteria bacterium]|jgi:ribosomal protein L11 methyltransferase|nr:50S ribosomal protein L11 methyltransferase [Deltaproteobacteria bacterium]